MDPASRAAWLPARRRFLLSVAAVAFAAARMLAGDGATLSGAVVDAQGRPVAGARISVAGPLGVHIVHADGDGRFVMSDLADATYRVVVEAPGLLVESHVVSLSHGAAEYVDITLGVAPLAESVVVSASHVETALTSLPASVSVVTAADLQARQTETLGDALRTLPGFTVTRNGTRGALTSLLPRGGESDFTLVLVDGVRVNAFGGGFDLAQMAIGNVERIEVVRGPQSAVYGADAIGGVVQVVTSHGGPARGEALVEGGSQDTSRAAVWGAGSTGTLGWSGSVERGASDGFTGQAPASGETVSNDDWWQRQFAGAVGWSPRPDATLRATGRLFESRRGFPGPYGSDPIGAFPGVDRISRGHSDDRQFGASAALPWAGGRARQRFSASYSRLATDFTSPFGPSAFVTHRLDLRAQADLVITSASSVSAGVEALGEEALSTYITDETFEETPVERLVVGYFGEWRQQVGSRAALTAGLRLERIRRSALAGNPSEFAPRPPLSDDVRLSLNPRVTFVLGLGESTAGAATRLHAAAGTGIRPPDAYEIAFTDNPSLKPERSRSVEAGVAHAIGQTGLELTATAFRNDYDDLIVAVARAWQDASRFRTDNIANARAQGVELETRWRALDGVELSAAYTFLDTAILAVDRGADAPPPFSVGDPLVRRPRHQASAALVVTASRATLFAEAGARGRVLDIEPNFGAAAGLFRTPGFTVVNAGGTFRPHPRVEVFARAANLFDRAYEETLGYPALGRHGMAGVRVAVGR
jgi:outer membrane cobalamin receptor